MAALTAVLLTAWIALFLYGMHDPALAASMRGKRDYCFFETLAYSLPIALVLLMMLKRGCASDSFWAGTMTGLAAAALPAGLMQLACVYEPNHILSHHILPIFIIGLVFAVLGDIALSRAARELGI
jgi:hypothetical protein